MEEYYEPGKFQGWYPPKRVPTCFLVTLEKIKIGRFRGQETELKVVEYFLTYAKVLKIMDIWFDRYQRRQLLSEYEVLRKLLEIPRGSTSCKVRVTCQAKEKGVKVKFLDCSQIFSMTIGWLLLPSSNRSSMCLFGFVEYATLLHFMFVYAGFPLPPADDKVKQKNSGAEDNPRSHFHQKLA